MGLTEKEASAKLKAEGLNTLEEKKKTSAVKIFAGQFKDVMVMILLAEPYSRRRSGKKQTCRN